MGEVIHADFSTNEDVGYITSGSSDNLTIDGVYVGNSVIVNNGGEASLASKLDDGYNIISSSSVDDINELCLMWLLIFNPEVIAEGK